MNRNARLLETIYEKIKLVMHETGTPGLSVGIISHKRNINMTCNFGIVDVDTNVPVTDRSVWQICSITKNIAATSVAYLVSQNRTSFDSRINEEIDVPFVNKHVTKHATIRDAFSHTTGLPENSGSAMSSYFYPLSNILQTVEYTPLTSFRKYFNYSNLGIAIGYKAACARSRLGGTTETLNDFTRMIGMKNVIVGGEFVPNSKHLVKPHTVEKGKHIAHDILRYDPFVGADGIFCTIYDLNIFINFHLNCGENLVPPKILDQLYIPVIEADGIRNGMEYGMGTAISNYEIHGTCYTVYGHGGAYEQGFMHQMLYDVEHGVGCVVLTNELGAIGIALSYYIYFMLLGLPEAANKYYDYYYTAAATLIEGLTRTNNILDTFYIIDFDMSLLLGVYVTQLYGNAEIKRKHNSYYIKVGNCPWAKLKKDKQSINFSLETAVSVNYCVVNPTIISSDVIGIDVIDERGDVYYVKIK